MSDETQRPLHHLSDLEFSRHLDERYGPLADRMEPDYQAVGAAMRMLGTDHDSAWDAYQEARYPGTQETVEVRRGLFEGICEFAKQGGSAAKLFEALDPGLAGETDPVRRLLRYEHVCEEYFNFRLGPDGRKRERQEVEGVLKAPREEVGTELWDTIFEVASELGMVESSELQDGEQIKHMAILGGIESAISNRTRYAIDQVKKHKATIGTLDFLAAEEEMDSVLRQAAALGAVKEASRQTYPDGIVITLEPVDIGGNMVPVRVLVANDIWSEEEGKMVRARTLETTKLWGEVSDIQPGDNVVGVTTGLYTAFQNANGREVLTFANRGRVRVIGHSAEWAGMKRYANQLTQEIKSAVDSEYRLYLKLVEAGIAPPIPERYEVDVDALYQEVPDMTAERAAKAGYMDEPIDTEHPLHKEPLVNVADYGLAGQAYYSRENAATGDAVPQADSRVFLRRSVAEELRRINESLTDPAITAFFGGEVELYLEDGRRPIETQRLVHDKIVPELLRRDNPGITEEELIRRRRDIIALPSENPRGPSPHLTGGAFDVILRYKQKDRGYVPGVNVPMGHSDGETSVRLYPDHFEHQESMAPEDDVARRNRRAFMAIMTGSVFGVQTGFTPNPTEWFHWGRLGQLERRFWKARGQEVPAVYSIAPLPGDADESAAAESA